MKRTKKGKKNKSVATSNSSEASSNIEYADDSSSNKGRSSSEEKYMGKCRILEENVYILELKENEIRALKKECKPVESLTRPHCSSSSEEKESSTSQDMKFSN